MLRFPLYALTSKLNKTYWRLESQLTSRRRWLFWLVKDTLMLLGVQVPLSPDLDGGNMGVYFENSLNCTIMFCVFFLSLPEDICICFLQRGRGREKEKRRCESMHPARWPMLGPGMDLPPRHVPWLGTEPSTLRSRDRAPTTELHRPGLYGFLCVTY